MTDSTSFAAAPAPLRLSALPDGVPARVLHLDAPDAARHWADWLAQLGFFPDEPVRILRRYQPGGDPMAVQIGDSVFALRRAEAACVWVSCAAPMLARAVV